MESGKSPLGMILFVLYLILYGGFVLLNAFAPETMEITPMAGVNLAIWYGVGLIVTAIALALIYGWSSPAESSENENATRRDKHDL